MPLTSKGEEIMAAMKKEYGTEKGKQVFYASKNAGKISGVDDMNGGTEGLKTYGDAESHHHEIKGETGPAIKDAGMGLVHHKEEKEAKEHKDFPKAVDNEHGMRPHGSFPNDPFGHEHYGTGGFEQHNVMSPSAMKNSPLAHFKE